MKTKITVLALLALFIYSCSSTKTTTPVAVASTSKSEMTSDQAEGKRIFETNCAKCHDLYNPKQFTAQQWEPILKRMQVKAQLDDTQREKIYSYIIMN